MGYKKLLTAAYVLLHVALCCCLTIGIATAQYTSPNYRVDETFFGTGGELDASSPGYRAKQSAGELGVGNISSTSYQAYGGFNTDRIESLEFIVNATNTNLGTLASGTTATTTGTFSVKAYLAQGYVVQTASDPPQNGAYTLTNLTSPTASATNTEQFGMNLVANTAPTTFGANPSQQPDSTFSFGAAATGYDTTNLYKYVKDDIIAQSTKSSGVTNYTISYIFNIRGRTPGGTYTFNHVLVATATY
jgi:hypothetical protein